MASASDVVSDRVVTIPNLLSFLRLLGVPLFLWLVLGPQADLWALLVLALSGISDWADGRIARALGQTSRVGQLLDPLADRLYVLAVLVAFGIRDIVPWWLVGLLVGRDLVLLAVLPLLRRHGYGPLPVHYLGKAATFNLMYGFPMLLLGIRTDVWGAVFRPLGWAFALWGAALYLWSGVLYLVQVRQLVRADRGA